MSKAFDRIRWDFLEHVLLLYGFPSHWVHLIMQCVTTVSYSVLVNGSYTSFFHPSQGLRQGDPLSPYLFVLCVDILSSMISSAKAQGLIEGIKASRLGPSITHLLFADDSFLFLKVTDSGISTIHSILNSYCQLSGQLVNLQKSSIFISPNSPPSLYSSISSSIHIPFSPSFGKYLGVNLDLTSKRKEIFQEIINKIDDKCQGWVSLLLNKAGRLSLLKYILTSMLVFHMSNLKFPVYVTKKISSILSNFLWSGAANKKSYHWKKWDSLCLSNSDGGLGVKDLQLFNQALLAKQSWRILDQPTCLFSSFFLSKYCNSTPFLESKAPSSCSWSWKSILYGKDALIKGIRWQVGNGVKISIWNDFWLPSPIPFALKECLSDNAPLSSFLSLRNATVDKLLLPEKKEWNGQLVSSLFPSDIASLILSIPLSQFGFEDRFIWGFTKNGDFSVSSAYSLLLAIKSHHNHSTSPNLVHSFWPNLTWNFIWSLPIPHKIQFFLWQLSHECLPVGDLLVRRGWQGTSVCTLCKHHSESLVHLFLLCDFVRPIWFGSDLGILIPSTPNHSISFWLGWLHNMGHIMSLHSRSFFSKISCTLWCIWLARNKAVFESIFPSPSQVLTHANHLTQSINQAFTSLKPSRNHSTTSVPFFGKLSPGTSNPSHPEMHTFHVTPCLCNCDDPVLDIFCAHAFNMQRNKCGVGITFRVQSRTVGSIFRSSSSPKDCASILPLIEAVSWALHRNMLHIHIYTNDSSLFYQLRSIKEIPAIAAPLFFDFCFLVQSVHFCSLSLCDLSRLHQAYFLAKFAASSRIHSEVDTSYPFDTG
ncbi:hypothetical protein RHGRI_025876 [Rhododendron griersonianum]|uniref:Reverse transcriptase domain-containing protein n=3 Tax=Rhododendron griersonianum TaxID=479676 RepID=A0AAV6IU68_9ERIC|nr:hypothetical protein RHGRI_025876 [Rhododendron griersonianum]